MGPTVVRTVWTNEDSSSCTELLTTWEKVLGTCSISKEVVGGCGGSLVSFEVVGEMGTVLSSSTIKEEPEEIVIVLLNNFDLV